MNIRVDFVPPTMIARAYLTHVTKVKKRECYLKSGIHIIKASKVSKELPFVASTFLMPMRAKT